MAEPGTITMKLVLDTTEAEAQIAALQVSLRKGAGGFATGGHVRGPATISRFIVDIVGQLDGVVISPTDSEYLIQCIRSRTY
jgi:hypothetical protein